MRRVNGQPTDHLSLADRAFQFGDGVFRTLKLHNGGLVCWARQLHKLRADCSALGIAPPDEAALLADIRSLCAEHGQTHGTLKIVITRGETARGYLCPADVPPNRIVQLTPPAAYADTLYRDGAVVRLCQLRASWQPALAGIKHLNRLENVLARQEWYDPSILEGLLLDRDGRLLEGVSSNLLLWQHGTLRTPCLDGGGVAGVMRELALELAPELGWSTEIGQLTLDDLWQAERVWLSNSLMGLLPVARLATHRWPVDPDCALRRAMARRQEEETVWL